MQRPTADIEVCREAHQRLAVIVDGMSDATVGGPSLLPTWTRGHVLSHLARNAESACRRIEAAQRGEVVEQYLGGAAGRAAEIEAGAARPARRIVEDVVVWAGRLDAMFGSVSEERWSRPVATVSGETHPLGLLPSRRWREVEIHLVDLDVGLTAADWPDRFVDQTLPGLLAQLPDRTDARQLVAWALGRGDPPILASWG